MSYSIPCYFQVTECCMNTSSKCEVKNHNKILNLKSTKAYQIITDNKEKQLVKSVDLCHIFLIKVTKTRLILGNYCCINQTTINQMTIFFDRNYWVHVVMNIYFSLSSIHLIMTLLGISHVYNFMNSNQ